jgi:hypothetical protein
MKYFTLTLAFMLVVATTPAFAYQSGMEDPGTSDPGTSDPGTSDPGTSDPGTSDPGTSDPPNSPPPTNWEFTSPDDGMESYGEVVFSGTGPADSIGGLSIYSYSNSTPGTVLGSEVQLQMAVLVDTDPGTDWVGPIYGTPGTSYATIMPAVGVPNVSLLTLIAGGGYAGISIDLGTLSLIGGGDSVLFNIVEQ